MAATQAGAAAASGKKLFGLPRTWAIVAIAAGLLLVAWFWYRSRSSSTSQAALPASSDVSAPDQSTAAPAYGGTPASGASQATLSGADLVNAFNSQEALLTGAFTTQEQLISQLAGGYEQLAMTSEQQLGSLAAGLIQLIPKAGSVTTSTGSSSGGGGGSSAMLPPNPVDLSAPPKPGGSFTVGGGYKKTTQLPKPGVPVAV